MLIQFWCNGIISNQVRGFVCSPGFIRDERNEEKWQQYFVITNQANWISQPFIALHSKKSNNPFASVWIVNRGITFYHCSVSDSRVRYFSWPGHGGVTRCHAVTINNTNVPLSGGQILCREDLVRQSIDCWNFLKCSALSMFSVSTLVMIDQMPRLQFSINLSRVASPELGGFLSPLRLSQWTSYPWHRCMAAVSASLSAWLTWYNHTPVSRALIHTNRVIQMVNLISNSQPRSDPGRW